MAGCHNKLLKRAVSKFVRYLIHPLFIVGLVFILIGLVCSCLLNGYTALGTWFAALGTWLLAWIGFWGVVTAIKAKQREILSGLKIGRVDPSGVAWIKNTSKEWIKFKVSLNRKEDFDHKEEDYAKAWVNYSNGCDDFVCDKIKQAIEEEVWKPWHRDKPFKLAPGAKVPIHLKNIKIEETYVALAAVKIEIDEKSLDFLGCLVEVKDEERTRVVLYRYAGGKASAKSYKNRDELHPHNQWVAVESH